MPTSRSSELRRVRRCLVAKNTTFRCPSCSAFFVCVTGCMHVCRLRSVCDARTADKCPLTTPRSILLREILRSARGLRRRGDVRVSRSMSRSALHTMLYEVYDTCRRMACVLKSCFSVVPMYLVWYICSIYAVVL